MRTPPGPNGNSKKKLSLRRLTVLAVCLLMLFLIVRRREIHVYDGFESGPHWSESRMVPGSFRVQSDVVRAGRGAGEITVHSGDRREAASDSGAASERDELMEAWWLFAHIHRAYRHSFSLYEPLIAAVFPQPARELAPWFVTLQ